MSSNIIEKQEPKSHEFFIGDSYSTLRLSGNLNAQAAVEFEADLTCERLTGLKGNLLVNCECLEAVSYHWIRPLMVLSQKLKSLDRRMALFGLQEHVLRYLCEQGVAKSFPIMVNTRAALREIGQLPKAQLDVNFINPFLSATMKVLQVQAFTEAKAGNIQRKGRGEKFSGDISGVIGLISDEFSGSVVISFPQETFLRIIGRMIGEDYDALKNVANTINNEFNSDLTDGAGEITNMIFGQAKLELNGKGYGIKTALPSVITGSDHSVLTSGSQSRIVVPFETDVGFFSVEICMS